MKLKKLFIVCVTAATSLLQPAYAHTEGNYVPSNLFDTMQAGDKAALLLVHFGTTHDDTRALTIDAINEKARVAFPELEFREAYTSRIVMNRLAKRGVYKKNPVEALAQLKADGYTHILIQSTNIIDGIEMESLRKDIALMKDLFKDTPGYTSFVCSRRLPESRFDPGRKRKGENHHSPCRTRDLHTCHCPICHARLYVGSRRTSGFCSYYRRRLSNT